MIWIWIEENSFPRRIASHVTGHRSRSLSLSPANGLKLSIPAGLYNAFKLTDTYIWTLMTHDRSMCCHHMPTPPLFFSLSWFFSSSISLDIIRSFLSLEMYRLVDRVSSGIYQTKPIKHQRPRHSPNAPTILLRRRTSYIATFVSPRLSSSFLTTCFPFFSLLCCSISHWSFSLLVFPTILPIGHLTKES
jgi:hypothetical protein